LLLILLPLAPRYWGLNLRLNQPKKRRLPARFREDFDFFVADERNAQRLLWLMISCLLVTCVPQESKLSLQIKAFRKLAGMKKPPHPQDAADTFALTIS